MLSFDIKQPPPTRQELDAEKLRLEDLKKRLVKQSLISDGCHGLALAGLYFSNMLTGYGLLAIICAGTAIALVLAATLKNLLSQAGLTTVVTVAAIAALVVAGTVHGLQLGSTLGSYLSAVLTASIILFSTQIGRQLLPAFNGLEMLKSLAEREDAVQELLLLCRDYPQFEDYRQQAKLILRPNLTFGELQAMRDAVKQNHA